MAAPQHVRVSASSSVERKPRSSWKMLGRFMQLYWLDWAAFIVLLTVAVVASLLAPYNFYVNTHYMEDYMYPLRKNSIPVPVILVSVEMRENIDFCRAPVAPSTGIPS